MADMKKYVGQVAFPQLVTEIKNADAKTLQAAKDYCDSKDKNFEVAGAGATAEANAKAYTDEVAATLEKAGEAAKVQVNLDTEVQARKDADAGLQGQIDGVKATADKAAEDVATLAQTHNTDKEALVAKDEELAGAISDLDEKVGAIPVGEDGQPLASTIVELINKKTEGIATDAAIGQLQSDLDVVEGEVEAIKADYLKAADKTELQGKIDDEAATRKADDEALASRIKVVEDDYLKAADKTELSDKIDEVDGREDVLVGEDAGKSARTIANEELAKQLIAEGAKESLDTLAEIAAWIQSHPDDASAMNKAIEDLEALVGTLPEGITATTIVGYIQEVVNAEKSARETAINGLDGRLTTVEGAVATKAEAQALTDAVNTLEQADADQVERIAALEEKFVGEGSVEDIVSDAKQEAIDTAAQDATTKANTAEANAKKHADDLNTAMNTRVEALEAVDHEHANKAELDKFVDGDKAKLDDAAVKAHEHANKAELDKVAEGDVAKWNAAEQNAKDYADGLNTAMTTKVDGVDAKVTKNAQDIATKASQEDLDDVAERLTTAEEGIASNKARLDAMVEYTPEEITAMFA